MKYGYPVQIPTDIGGIANFDPHGDRNTLSLRWIKWKRGFELILTSKGVNNAEQKKALLLHSAGPSQCSRHILYVTGPIQYNEDRLGWFIYTGIYSGCNFTPATKL